MFSWLKGQKLRRGTITRTCRSCGKSFTLPENVQNWPDYCQECRAKNRASEMISRTCRGCGKVFSFSATLKRWPKYCQECSKKKSFFPWGRKI